jgi:hypothetical protein
MGDQEAMLMSIDAGNRIRWAKEDREDAIEYGRMLNDEESRTHILTFDERVTLQRQVEAFSELKQKKR